MILDSNRSEAPLERFPAEKPLEFTGFSPKESVPLVILYQKETLDG